MANDGFSSALDTTRKGKDFAAPGTARYIPAEKSKDLFLLAEWEREWSAESSVTFHAVWDAKGQMNIVGKNVFIQESYLSQKLGS